MAAVPLAGGRGGGGKVFMRVAVGRREAGPEVLGV